MSNDVKLRELQEGQREILDAIAKLASALAEGLAEMRAALPPRPAADRRLHSLLVGALLVIGDGVWFTARALVEASADHHVPGAKALGQAILAICEGRHEGAIRSLGQYLATRVGRAGSLVLERGQDGRAGAVYRVTSATSEVAQTAE